MILPIGDDNPNEKTPYVHYLIMALNVMVFLYTLRHTGFGSSRAFYLKWGLVPARFSMVKVFTSMYFHGGLGHIFGNMLFLWIVGDNVEDRLGHVGYLAFYHLAGVAACLVHVATDPHATIPLVGASGAISGVMGAYAVFFPRARIKIWYWIFLFFTDIIYVSAKWAVGLWFVEQLLLWSLGGGMGVAYGAHVGGIVFGVVVALALRKLFLKEPDSVRRILRTAAPAGGARPRPARGPAPELPQWEQLSGPQLQPQLDDNAGIMEALEAGHLQLAYRYFTRATTGFRRVPLRRQTAMRLADALLRDGRYGPAARVYEVIVETLPESDDTPEAAFRLGTILSRASGDYARARDYLTRAYETHPDVRRRRSAYDELKRIDALLRRSVLRRGPL